MKLEKLVGRQKELEQLQERWHLGGSSFVVCKGRRRIGKSRLIEEFSKISGARFLEFQGLAPRDGINNNNQLDHFAEQLAENTESEVFAIQNWNQAFTLLASQITQKRTVVLLDEISWMAGNDPDFAGKLKVAWDTKFKKHRNLILVICGSVSSWIEKNILKNTDFEGRVDLTLSIEELELPHVDLFWGKRRQHISAMEKLKVLGVTGGVPKYLEEINPTQTAEQNIQRICFSPGGFLFKDFEKIFNEVFDRRAGTYRKIVEVLSDGRLTFPEISEKAKLGKSGRLLEYLNDLEMSGLVSQDYVYDIKNGKQTKLNKYRLRDNFLRFYLKYVRPHESKISKGIYQLKSLETLPNWETVMGLQFENTIQNNIHLILKALKLDPNIVQSASHYFQKAKARNKGACDIEQAIPPVSFKKS